MKRPVYLFVLPWSLRIIGGVNQVVTNLARQMRETGTYEPLVLSSDWDAPDPVFEEVHGIRTVRWRVRPYRRGMGIKEKLAYLLWERRFGARFSRFCSTQNIQAVNIHYPNAMAFSLERVLRSQGARLPLLLSFHGTDVSMLADSNEQLKCDWRELTGRAHATVACSRHLAERMRKALGADVACQVIYNGVDAEKFVARRMEDPAVAKNVILHVGKFDYNKGQDVLIEAFSRIAADFPDVSLHLVGSRGERLSSLRTLAMETGLGDRIEFFVDVPPAEMPSYFCRASMFAFPSRQEGFPLVLLEAGALSLPVVASRVGGIPELIDGVETGVLIEPDDPAALAAVLRSWLNEPSAAQQLGQGLHRRVSENFSWINALQRYEALVDHGSRQSACLAAPRSTKASLAPDLD
jgi:glycosyltransferase involved in cell wall biosynthesis